MSRDPLRLTVDLDSSGIDPADKWDGVLVSKPVLDGSKVDAGKNTEVSEHCLCEQKNYDRVTREKGTANLPH